LANSRYATIREHNGRLYLYMKTIERAHTPNKLWERMKLSQNYERALDQVDSQLQYWPKALIHRNKQRLTKIHQYLIRSRKLKLTKNKPKIVTVNHQQEKLEDRREVKALKAAKLENSIKGELLERLKKGAYGDIYNFPEVQYEKVLDAAQQELGEDDEDVEKLKQLQAE
jgi:protein MAK16